MEKKIDTSKTHSFEICIAMEVGIPQAVILKNINYWCEFNEANSSEHHYHNGRYWTYNSAKAFAEMFPYMNYKSIGRWMIKMVEDGWMVEGNFHKDKWEKSKWYSIEIKYAQTLAKAFTDSLEIKTHKNSIAQNEQSNIPNRAMEDTKLGNRSDQTEQSPITYIKPNIKTDIKMRVFSFFRKGTPDKVLNEVVKYFKLYHAKSGNEELELSLLDFERLINKFEEFRKEYNGSKKGTAIEFVNLAKKNSSDWFGIIPKLLPAFLDQVQERKESGRGEPEKKYRKHLSTWINNFGWTFEVELKNPRLEIGEERTVVVDGKTIPVEERYTGCLHEYQFRRSEGKVLALGSNKLFIRPAKNDVTDKTA